jgi:hypothetical protein
MLNGSGVPFVAKDQAMYTRPGIIARMEMMNQMLRRSTICMALS